jgi:hypothetical protein
LFLSSAIKKKMRNVQMAVDNSANKEWVITEVLNKLKREEYKLNFRREATCLYCFQLKEWIKPEYFTVDKYYYFEDILNPYAERMLYAISLSLGGKGFLIDTCSVYMDNISPEMMQKLQWNKIKRRKDDLTNAGKMKNLIKTINEALIF